VEITASNPARLWGVSDRKGEIRPEMDADFVLVDLSKRMTLGPAQVLSGAGWSIYEGVEFQGWPVATILGGRVVAEWSGDTCAVSDAPRGKYLARDPTGHDPRAERIA
jgi:dihydropyrimidinase